MSDFVSDFWGYYVAIITLVSIIACGILLYSQTRRPPKGGSAVETTGHVWDVDLVELNNPLPRWWMWLFYITIVFSLVYLVLYPGFGSYRGLLGWSSEQQLKEETARAEAVYGPLFVEFRNMNETQLASDTRAMAMGERLYLNNCAQCHGSDGRGSRGFPDLTDRDWLYGGSFAAIKESVRNGRHGVMPPMAAAVGSAQDVENVAHYVLSLSGSAHDSLRGQLGRAKFAACAACHGADGKGNPALGAPNLTDRIWLHGGSVTAIVNAVTRGIDNRMPAHADILGADRAHVVAAYVWSLSNPRGSVTREAGTPAPASEPAAAPATAPATAPTAPVAPAVPAPQGK